VMVSPLPRNKRARHPSQAAEAGPAPAQPAAPARPQPPAPSSAPPRPAPEAAGGQREGFTNNPFAALNIEAGQS